MVTEFRSTYGQPLQLAEMGLMLLPVLIGVFLAAPLIAREMEAGTHKLVLSQSVGPLRWLAAKTAVPALVVLAATTVLSVVFAWMWAVVGDEVSGAYWYSPSASPRSARCRSPTPCWPWRSGCWPVCCCAVRC